MIKDFKLTNKIILITGGYGYLGKAITESLIFHDATVYVLGRNKSKFDEEFKKNKYYERKLNFITCNIESSEEIKNAYSTIFEKEKRIDVLINNAFYSQGQSPEEMNDEDWNYGIDGTLNSVFRSIREVIPFMKSSSKGKIINVSSMYGIVAPNFEVYRDCPEFLNPPHYGAAKAGVIQLSKYYAAYLGPFGINVNTISPGPFPSEKVQSNTQFIDKLKKETMLNKIGKPEDLAGAFVFLSSEASNFMTGQNIIVDGGWTAK